MAPSCRSARPTTAEFGVALRWRDVEFAGAYVRVTGSYTNGELSTPKSGEVRSVPMAPEVGEAPARLGQRQRSTASAGDQRREQPEREEGNGDRQRGRDAAARCRSHRAPTEVAPLVAFLLSDEASFIAGAEIPVGGGQWAHGGAKALSDALRPRHRG